jgi:hypothetical protein
MAGWAGATAGQLYTSIPFSPPLQNAYRPDAEKIYRAAKELAKY